MGGEYSSPSESAAIRIDTMDWSVNCGTCVIYLITSCFYLWKLSLLCMIMYHLIGNYTHFLQIYLILE